MTSNRPELSTWRALWDDRGLNAARGIRQPLRAAIDADGFDWGPGFVDDAAHRRWAEQALDLLDVQPHQRVLDCGSGAGAMSTYLLRALRCVSMDSSAPLLRLGSRLGTVRQAVAAEAGNLPFRPHIFDAILCNSVFQYFPDLDYARRALDELLRVCRPGRRVVLMDILDAERKAEALAARERSSRSVSTRRGSASLSHLYYDRFFFRDTLANRVQRVDFAEHRLTASEYTHAPYRYHVIITTQSD